MSQDRSSMDRGVARYVTGWVVVALIAMTVLLWGVGFEADPWAVAVFVGVVVVAERLELTVHFGKRVAAFSLVELALTLGLVLLPLGAAVVASAIGLVVVQLIRRLRPQQLAFNTAIVAAGMAVAGAVVTVFPSVPPTIEGRSVVAVLLGMVVYAAVNAMALAGLMLRLAGPDAWQVLRDQVPLTGLAMLGTTSMGVVVALVWVTEPVLTVLTIAPAAAIYLAAKNVQRSQALLQTIRADRDRLTRVVDGASDGIVLLGADGEIEVWSQAMTALTGLEEEAVAGRPIASVLTDERRLSEEPVRGRWLMEGASDRVPVRERAAVLRHRDGSERNVVESHAFVFDDRGRCTGAVVVVRDVTRQAALERLRSDFVARVSHELRTPLTPIRGFASVLLRRGEALDGAQREAALRTIMDRADHLGRIVEDLLLVTRVERGEVDDLVEPRETRLAAVVEAAVDRLRAVAPERTLVLSVADDLPAAWVDPERLGQALDALLDNAARYTPGDSPIEVDVEPAGEDLRVRIRDHGPGIPEEDLEAVFERFHRLEDPMTMTTGGVGLGLFLARQLTVAMRGRLVAVLPEEGGGVCMELEVPATLSQQSVAVGGTSGGM